MKTFIKTLSAIIKRTLGCSVAPLGVTAILFIAITATAQTVWNGTADTTWYTSHKEDTEFIITTAEQLAGLAQLVNGSENNDTYNMGGKTITLGNDIVLNDTTGWENWGTTAPINIWTAIGRNNNSFIGTFDGNGYVISGVYINTTSDYQGLFGYVYYGTIKNVGVVAYYIKGDRYVGGLVGRKYSGSVSNSYSIGVVSGSNGVGGLVGSNGGTVSNSYFVGRVSASNGSGNLGELVGANEAGNTISNSYYDKEISGQTDADRAGKTTAEMKSEEFADILNKEAIVLSMNAWIYKEGEYPSLSNALVKISSYFASGDGTEASPYIITTKEHLENFSLFVNMGKDFTGEYLKLDNDITLNDTTDWHNWGTTAPANSWDAIGNKTNKFSGNFDGAGHTVSGVYINNTNSYQGLFGYLGSGGTINNIGVVASYIKGYEYIGGLVGMNDGTISNSYSTGAVSGTELLGGLVGSNKRTVINSYSTGAVSGTELLGGLVGRNEGTVSNSYSIGAVSGTSFIGGLVGYNGGTVSNSYYDKETSKRTDTDKGEGKTTAEMKTEEFADILNIGAGILSMNSWDYKEGEYPKLTNILITVTNYFANGNGTEADPYIIKTKEHLENLSLLVNMGKDFTGEYLKLDNDITLNDTTDWHNWGTTAPANSWAAIGNKDKYPGYPFNGNFDGAGYVISGVYINTTDYYQGLFGYLGSDGTINNIGVVASYISGSSVGGLVGWNFGAISNSYSTGTVNGSGGGLVGSNRGTVNNSYSTCTISGGTVGGFVGDNGGTINNSYSTGAVSGSNGVGGLVGYNSSTVSNSYSTGNVRGTGLYVGGLVGQNWGTVGNSYSTGAVSGVSEVGGLVGWNEGIVSNSYYDIQTSGLNDEGKGEGKTTAEMKTQSTYVGWDFVDIWAINPTINNGYPYLKEEISTPILPQIAVVGKIQAQTIGNNIVLQNLPNNSKVEVYNLKGNRIYSGNTGNISTLSIGVQTKGMYIVRASFGSGRQVMRVTVK